MAVRPKVSSGIPNNGNHEDGSSVFGGYVMHQKTYRSTMRWGQLTTEVKESNSTCVIRLYKCNIVNGEFVQKDLREKLSFEINEDNFCAIERGTHRGRYGVRRFICVVTRTKHLVVQEAVTASTSDHDVIQTWYTSIKHAMQFVNSWRLKNKNKKSSEYQSLNLTKTNLSICQSLQNLSTFNKTKTFVHNVWSTKNIQNAQDFVVHTDGEVATHLQFQTRQHDGSFDSVNLIIEGQHKGVLASIEYTPPQPRMVCPTFSDLSLNPNLVKISQNDHSKTNGLNIVRPSNTYIDQSNLSPGLPQPITASNHAPPSNQPITNNSKKPQPIRTSDLPKQRGNENFQPITGHEARPRPPANERPRPPRPHFNDRQSPDRKKSAADMTQLSLDLGYDTMDNLTNGSGYNQSEPVVLNIQGVEPLSHEPIVYQNINPPQTNEMVHPETLQMRSENNSENETNVERKNESDVEYEKPPDVPKRETDVTVKQRDHVRDCIEQQTLQPIDQSQPGYQNSMRLEVTIYEILQGFHREALGRNLDLPHSVFMKIAIGLERSTDRNNGNWIAFANELGLTFADVVYLEDALRSHANLMAAEVLMLHWQRTQAPVPYTLENLHALLLKLERLDLAEIINASMKQ